MTRRLPAQNWPGMIRFITLDRAVGVLIVHADQRYGKARQRSRLGIKAGEDKSRLDGGQRQPLFYPAEGVQPRGGFVR